MPSLPTLDHALRRKILLLLDMKSLLQLRACSRAYLEVATKELHDHMESVVTPFVPNPRTFLDLLPSVEAYIGGSAVIPFFVRDAQYRANALEVFVPFAHVIELCDHLTEEQGAREEDDFGSDDDFDDYLPHRASRSVTRYSTPAGIVVVICSRFMDPLAPIACAWSSLHACYANPKYFGHGYAALTLRRRGLIGDGIGEENEVCGRMRRMRGRGFDLRLSSRAWPEYAPLGVCSAQRFACATQPRTFLDEGAMRCRVKPLHDETIHSTVMWRLDYRPCGGRCFARQASDGMLGPSQKFVAL